MDPTIGALLGVAVGSLITGGAGWLLASKQRTWQLEDFERERQNERDREVRERADAKAEDLLGELLKLERLLFETIRLDGFVWPDDPAKMAEVRACVERLTRAGLYLQEPLRHHVELAAQLLPDLDRLAGEGWIKESARSAAYVLINQTRFEVARYLRSEVVSAGLSDRQSKLRDAHDELEAAIERDIEQQLAHEGEEDSQS